MTAAAVSCVARQRRRPPGPHAAAERGYLFDVQRARLLSAAGQVACERGAANVTVGQIVEHAGVSRRTFYDTFDDVEDCLLAVFQDALKRAQARVLGAWASEGGWRDRVRGSLTELLGLFDEDPVLAQLLVVESLGAGRSVLESRLRVLDAVIESIEASASRGAQTGSEDMRLSAEGAIGGMLGVLHARIARKDSHRLLTLAGPFMSMLVLPYHGARQAKRELSLPAPLPKGRQAIGTELPFSPDPFKKVGMRLTYRTTRALSVAAKNPGASNRQIAELAGINDQGQASKLLTRLERIGMIANHGNGLTKGEPNAWSLTPAGEQLIKKLGSSGGANATPGA